MAPFTDRSALAQGFSGVFLVCSVNTDKRARPASGTTSAWARAAAAGPFEPFQRDLPIAPVARPVSQTKAQQKYVLTMKPGTASILPGITTPVIGYAHTASFVSLRAPTRAHLSTRRARVEVMATDAAELDSAPASTRVWIGD